jgi:hypothetical protein
MKAKAKKVAGHTELAPDFAKWQERAWLLLRSEKGDRGQSDRVVQYSMSWLQRAHEADVDRAELKVWWSDLQPFLQRVVSEGQRADCSAVFFSLRDGGYNEIALPDQILELAGSLAARIANETNAGDDILDERDPAGFSHHSWRQCADDAAAAIDSLREDGSLNTESRKERAHELLSHLADRPIRSSGAFLALCNLNKA